MNSNNKNLKSLSVSISLFDSNQNKIDREENKKIDLSKKLLDKYFIKDMNDWKDVNADLIITDPPFGIKFSGKNGNYHRNVNNVVGGYVEWSVSEYAEKIQQLLE